MKFEQTESKRDSHDLRTALTIIKGHTQLAERAVRSLPDHPERILAHLDIVLKQVELITRLVATIEARGTTREEETPE